MLKNRKRVLVIATSHKTKGGITSVVKSHKEGKVWKDFSCKWIETHIDRNLFWKFIYCVRAYISFFFLIPFYDIAHFHISEIRTLQRKYLLFLLAKLWKKKTIIHFHNNHFLLNSSHREAEFKLYAKVFSKADRVIVVSDYWKKWLKNHFGLDETVQVMYNSAPPINKTDDIIKEPKILYAGVITQKKGCYDLIQAFAHIANKYPDWQLELAGVGETEELIALVYELNLSNRVFFLGWISDEKKEDVFKSASIFCLPSYAEGFPMVILEAWQYGIPVITTKVGGIPDFVTNEVTGLLFVAGDIEALAIALESLIYNEDKRSYLSINALQLVKTKFDRDMINEELSNLYFSL